MRPKEGPGEDDEKVPLQVKGRGRPQEKPTLLSLELGLPASRMVSEYISVV